MPTELVPESATLTDSTLILVEVDMETGAMAGLESADGILAGAKFVDGILAGVKSADGIFDRVKMADSVQAGVESADLAYTVPKYAPEPKTTILFTTNSEPTWLILSASGNELNYQSL
jgi:hypothetical protein